MSSANKRLEKLIEHLNPDGTLHFESLRIQRKPDDVPNITKLDPLSFLLRSAMIYSKKIAIVGQYHSYTYAEFSERVRALSNSLMDDYSVQVGDRVGILCYNTAAFIEAQFAIPAIRGICVPLNHRLAAKEIEYAIEHSGLKVLIIQQELLCKLTDKSKSLTKIITVVDCDDRSQDAYEQILINSKKRMSWNDMPPLKDENDVISVNYTSGSTGRPKGVMVTYRGAYLTALGITIRAQISYDSVYLWTLPMFHCNGWSFPWALTAVGATQLMLDKLDYTQIWRILKDKGVTHYCGAPTVQNEICNHADAVQLSHPVIVFSGGSAFSPTLIRRMKKLNLVPNQVYGLTETYGPACISYEHSTISDHSEKNQHTLLSRPGYNIVTSDELRVLNQETCVDVRADGKEVGEVCMTGNLVMKGYYNSPEETKKSFRHGVFWTGDLAIRHNDGSIEIIDRCKDVIISGGENISSIEVENVIVELDEVSECAIVAEPSEKWGERPVAYVVLKGKLLEAEKIIEHCRNSLAGYKCPERVEFINELPKTSTGKVQKFILKEKLWKNHKKRIN